MNRNNIHVAAIGAAAGAAAGIALVAGALAWEEHQPWDKVTTAIARHRLPIAERAELDRLQAAEATRAAARDRATQAEQEDIRARFRPDLLLTTDPKPLTELSVPELISELYYTRSRDRKAWNTSPNPWREQTAALGSEFHRRYDWPVRRNLSMLDRRRMESAWPMVDRWDYERPAGLDLLPERAPAAPIAPAHNAAGEGTARTWSGDYPDFSGPDGANFGITSASTATVEE